MPGDLCVQTICSSSSVKTAIIGPICENCPISGVSALGLYHISVSTAQYGNLMIGLTGLSKLGTLTYS